MQICIEIFSTYRQNLRIIITRLILSLRKPKVKYLINFNFNSEQQTKNARMLDNEFQAAATRQAETCPSPRALK